MSRARYWWNPETKQLEELSSDWADTERRAPVVTEELVYGSARATDGADISSRKKHADYMRRNGLAMASDFSEHWKQKAAERQRVMSGDADTPARREAVGRALYEARRKRK
jgi:hypothetical protein